MMIRIDRPVFELGTTSIADGDFGNDDVQRRIDRRRDEQHGGPEIKMGARRGQNQKRSRRGEDDEKPQLLWEILADEQIAAAAFRAGG